MNEKVRRRTVLVGDKMLQMFVEFQKGGYTPPHAHVHPATGRAQRKRCHGAQ